MAGRRQCSEFACKVNRRQLRVRERQLKRLCDAVSRYLEALGYSYRNGVHQQLVDAMLSAEEPKRTK